MPADGSTGPVAASLFHAVVGAVRILDARARRQLASVLGLMALGAALEAVGAAVIVPFIALMNDPSYLASQPILRQLYERSTMKSPTALIMALSVTLLLFFVIKNLFLAALANAQFRFIYAEMPRFSGSLFGKYMSRPLSKHVETNSAEMIRNVSNEVFMYFTNFLIPTMTLLTEALILIAIVAVLLWIAPLATLTAMLLLGGLTLVFYGVVRAKTRHFGKLQQEHNAERMKWVKQGLGSIKETKVLACEGYFIGRFREHEMAFARSARYAMTLNQTPRLFIETIAYAALFSGVTIAIATGQDRARVLPVLALFAVAAVRLLPSLNRILLSITRMTYYRPAADIVLGEAREPGQPALEPAEARPAQTEWRELTLDRVSFAYSGSVEVLVDVDLTIRRGTSLALVGASGSGKTTLADLILGLLRPTRGRILLDGQDVVTMGDSWRGRLGYIPQSIFLLDDTIRRNVAFALPDGEIDDDRVWAALRMAHLEEYVRGLPEQLSTLIGENGGRLSGGQRQRVGIARALYRDPDVIVLDEATSALDEGTERAVADALQDLAGRKTLVVIAHRPETLERCQRAYSVERREYLR